MLWTEGLERLEIKTVSEIEAKGAEGSGVDFQEEGGDASRLPYALFLSVFS